MSKVHITKASLLGLLFISLALNVHGGTSTFIWTGASGTAWNVPGNWSSVGTSTSTFPGEKTGQTDDVTIGLVAPYSGNQPTITVSVVNAIHSLQFGGNFDGTITNPMTLTINSGTLSVNTAVTIINQTNTGSVSAPPPYTANDTSPVINITGTGTLNCRTTFTVGDGVSFPPGNGVNTITVNSSVRNFTVTANTFTLRSARTGVTHFSNPLFNLVGGTLTILQLVTIAGNGGTASGPFGPGQVCTFNMGITSGTNNLVLLGTTPFSLDASANINFTSTTTDPTLSTVTYGNSGSSVAQRIFVTADAGFNTAPTMYPNLVFANPKGVNAIRNALTVGGDWTTNFVSGIGLDLVTFNPTVTVKGNWNNNSFGVTMGSGAITVTGDWNNNSSSVSVQLGSGPVNVGGQLFNNSTITGNAALAGTIGTMTIGGFITNFGDIVVGNREVMTFNGDFDNRGVYVGGNNPVCVSTFNGMFANESTRRFTQNAADVIFNNRYTNDGIVVLSTTANTIFSSTTPQDLIDDSPLGTTFYNVRFSGGSISGGSKTLWEVLGNPNPIGFGGFFVASTGIMALSSNAVINAQAMLTLNSDANSTATIAAIPAGCGIVGTVKVERFIQGSPGSLQKRGFRLVSSPVFTATVAGVNVFDLNYIRNSVLVTGAGGTGNGFDASPLNNPSLYLFREDDPPAPGISVSFRTQYNWKGVAKINNTNPYDIGTQKKLTITNVADTTVNIPVGNGLLLFFRGDNTHNVVNKTTPPFSNPEDATTTQTGTLNTGTIDVKLWFANAANALGNTFSYTPIYAAPGAATLRGGYACVGNPYASTINWEKYNRNGANSSIFGTVSRTIYVLNEANGQYEPYTPKTTISSIADTTTSINPGTAIGSASNMIASGQGFFVIATAPGQTLSFRETAKTNVQPVAASLHNLMSSPRNGGPKEFVIQTEPLFRLKLIKDSINTDEIVIRMNKDASNRFLKAEDAEDLGGSNALESLSVFSSDSVALSIDYIPFPGKQKMVIPLLVSAIFSGNYELKVPRLINLPPLYQIWLKDAYTHDSLLMKTGAIYTFAINKSNTATFGKQRFSLVIGQDTAMSYKLLSFTGSKVPGIQQVTLLWTTRNEENYTHFTVERSTDGGKTFTVIGGLTGTAAGNYSLTDKSPVTGTNIYRLKQQDINDSVSYSQTVAVQFTDQGNPPQITSFPNPAKGVINVNLINDPVKQAPYVIRITNTSGLLVRQVTSSQPSWQTNVTDLLPGTYLIKVYAGKNNKLIGDSKFVKL